MNIPKAIEILTTYMKGSDKAEPFDFDNAIQLGIEALKLLQHQRTYLERAQKTILPGETKEG